MGYKEINLSSEEILVILKERQVSRIWHILSK